MEERDGAFSFFCSQKCLEHSHREGSDGSAACDGCAKRFAVTLASQVLYLKGKRVYACSMGCRSQLVRESQGARLGEMLDASVAPVAELPGSAPMAGGPVERRAAERVGMSAPGPERRALTEIAPRPVSVERDAKTASAPAAPVPAAPVPAATVRGEVVSVIPRNNPGNAASSAPPVSESRPRVIAVFNHKGGTGKTTTSVSLAAGLAMRGKRVLLVDTDAQGNVGVSLAASSERSLYHVLVMGLRVADAVKEVRPNLDLLPANETLAAAELYLAGRQNRDRVLRERLAAATASYDFVVLDCSPSLSLMNQNALVFADSVLVPVACDYLSLVGVRQVIKTVKNVNSLLHHPVQIWGVLPTFFDARANICHEAVGTLKEHFAERCLSPVRSAIKVKEAPARGQTIFEYAAGASAAEDYAAVVERVLEARTASENESAQSRAISAERSAVSRVG
jgi:chromosome partitioning protein